MKKFMVCAAFAFAMVAFGTVNAQDVKKDAKAKTEQCCKNNGDKKDCSEKKGDKKCCSNNADAKKDCTNADAKCYSKKAAKKSADKK